MKLITAHAYEYIVHLLIRNLCLRLRVALKIPCYVFVTLILRHSYLLRYRLRTLVVMGTVRLNETLPFLIGSKYQTGANQNVFLVQRRNDVNNNGCTHVHSRK